MSPLVLPAVSIFVMSYTQHRARSCREIAMASTESQEFFEHFEDSEDDYEPVATEDEIKEYENCVGKEKEEETRLEERFLDKTLMESWYVQ